ncbi:MAG: MerR family transcriptional regulator [Brachymonas sp.]|nr:MerR family transcriptional regulator [Brachymonas sp.]
MKTPVLPPIPAKRYFTIGEVADLCAVKPHVLRYWEQEFTQLNPMKRRGNRRYYQHHEVLMVRRIRDLLYEQGFTISGARSQLEGSKNRTAQTAEAEPAAEQGQGQANAQPLDASLPVAAEKKGPALDWRLIRQELEALRNFLS